jgi:hypothetical protein
MTLAQNIAAPPSLNPSRRISQIRKGNHAALFAFYSRSKYGRTLWAKDFFFGLSAFRCRSSCSFGFLADCTSNEKKSVGTDLDFACAGVHAPPTHAFDL